MLQKRTRYVAAALSLALTFTLRVAKADCTLLPGQAALQAALIAATATETDRKSVV
jgi:hypothetical protein